MTIWTGRSQCSARPFALGVVDLSEYGGVVNSVDVRNGVVAAAVEAVEKTDPGAVVFLDAASLAVLSAVEVGALPDMLAFSPNGRYVLVANEAEPNADYSIDPEGSISVIDVSSGASSVSQADVRTADFHAFDAAAARASSRRKWKRGHLFCTSGPTPNTLACTSLLQHARPVLRQTRGRAPAWSSTALTDRASE